MDAMDLRLIMMTIQGNTDEVMKCIENGANINCTDKVTNLTSLGFAVIEWYQDDENALIIASRMGFAEIVFQLCTAGANVDHCDVVRCNTMSS